MKCRPHKWKLLVILIFIIILYTYCIYPAPDSNGRQSIPILMVVTEWSHKRHNLFSRCVTSLISNTASHIRLHLILDRKSLKPAKKLVYNFGSRKVTLQTYFIEDILAKYSTTITNLQKFFSVPAQSYYRKGLFYLVPFVHQIIHEEKLILLDTDISVKGDIKELYDKFELFHSSEFWGVTYEQSPYYAKALGKFREKNKKTTFGDCSKNGGIPGLNTGVLLVDIRKLIQDTFIQDNYLTEKYYTYLVDRFEVQGKLVLGDQDFLSLLIFEHPELFHVLSCGWNRQLCKYFKEEFGQVFNLYYECNDIISIIHGNCNTTILDNQ